MKSMITLLAFFFAATSFAGETWTCNSHGKDILRLSLSDKGVVGTIYDDFAYSDIALSLNKNGDLQGAHYQGHDSFEYTVKLDAQKKTARVDKVVFIDCLGDYEESEVLTCEITQE